MNTTAIMSLLLSLGATQATPENPNRIEVEITNIEDTSGHMRCALFAKKGWLGDHPVAATKVQVRSTKVRCVFEDVPRGDYGLAIHHDQDDDDEMDTFLGIPEEPYGFSNDARGTMGPPSFEDARFTHDGEHTRMRARLD